jgi:hypothetical protein
VTLNDRTRIARLIPILLLLPNCCLGQSPAAMTRGGELYEISGTYTHVLTDGTFDAPLGMNGWTASASTRIWPVVQITAEAGGYRKTGASIYSFMAGPQLKMRVWRIHPFVRGLFGMSRVSSSADVSEFSVAGGGGIDVPFANHFSIRALQCDYYRFPGGNLSKTDLLRVGVGITYSFGD